MLRSGELLAAHRDELFDLDGEHPRFEVPLKAAGDPTAAFRLHPRGGTLVCWSRAIQLPPTCNLAGTPSGRIKNPTPRKPRRVAHHSDGVGQAALPGLTPAPAMPYQKL